MACDRRAVNAREWGPGISVITRMPDIASIPSNRRFVQIDVYLLGLKILINAMNPQFPAEAGLLETAPRSFHVGGLHVINPYNAGANGLDHAQGAIDVAGPDGCGQAEGGIVGDTQRLALVIEGDNRGHRAEDFFAG